MGSTGTPPMMTATASSVALPRPKPAMRSREPPMGSTSAAPALTLMVTTLMDVMVGAG